MNHQIHFLKDTELPLPLLYQLHPFISAYNDHTPLNRTDLDKDDRQGDESVLSQDNILDTYKATKHEKDVTYLGYKRKYLEAYKGCRSYYLG
jgi:hypothetical protein